MKKKDKGNWAGSIGSSHTGTDERIGRNELVAAKTMHRGGGSRYTALTGQGNETLKVILDVLRKVENGSAGLLAGEKTKCCRWDSLADRLKTRLRSKGRYDRAKKKELTEQSADILLWVRREVRREGEPTTQRTKKMTVKHLSDGREGKDGEQMGSKRQRINRFRHAFYHVRERRGCNRGC